MMTPPLLNKSPSHLAYKAIDAVSAPLALVDQSGMILLTNESWRKNQKTTENFLLRDLKEGDNLFTRYAHQKANREISEILENLKAAAAGEMPFFNRQFAYGCEGERNFCFLQVTSFVDAGERILVLILMNTTNYIKETEKRLTAQNVNQRKQEIQNLELLAQNNPTMVTADLYGIGELSQYYPDVYNELLQRYGRLLDLTLEKNAYKVDLDLTEGLRSIVRVLGFLKAGPRDLIHLHTTVLKEKLAGAPPAKAQVYADEGRLLALELMGHLVIYYRNHVTGRRTHMDSPDQSGENRVENE